MMVNLRAGLLNSPLGEFPAVVTDQGVCRVCFPGDDLKSFGAWFHRWFGETPEWGDHPLLERAGVALSRYFDGVGGDFDLPLDLRGSDFQIAVWRALLRIPLGETRTYGEIAGALGRGAAGARAVGHAVGSNPVPVFVPCHRVLGANGRLTGFGGGLAMKLKLLQVEGIVPAGPLPRKPSASWVARPARTRNGFVQKSLFE